MLHIRVYENTSAESLFGKDVDALVGCDVAASRAKYLEQLRHEILARWPDADVEVEGGSDLGRIDVWYDEAPERAGAAEETIREQVDDCSYRVWNAMGWVVMGQA